ncbi:MAG: helix-turn-helix domain-containing protein [Anaeroplasma sp.]|nr:helix-turn-helix domain-containing protein [Anaeroplasma sp.]
MSVFMTISEVSKLTHLDPQTVRVYISQGIIPGEIRYTGETKKKKTYVVKRCDFYEFFKIKELEEENVKK